MISFAQDYCVANLDPIDRMILDELQADGRLSNTELADRVGLSASACHRRVRRLESEGVIAGYVMVLDAAVIGRIDEERLRSLGLELANEQLAAEEALAERQRQAHQQATEAERREHRRDALNRCREKWDELAFAERFDLLRGLLERVVVRDDSIEVRPGP